LGKGVHLNRPGKKRISTVGMPLIAVAKTTKKHFLAHLMPVFNVQWDIFNKYHHRCTGMHIFGDKKIFAQI